MGIESDQLVYDYLSRVGDLAQQRQLPSAARMRLVSSLRDEIDRRRAKFGSDSPAAVRRILGRLGTPDEVVESVATGGAYEAPAEVETAVRGVPGQRDGGRGRRVQFPRPRASSPPPPPPSQTAASPPHLAGMDELGPSDGEPDWWRIEPGPMGGMPGESVAGFVGGVEIPEILRPPEEAVERAEPSDAEPSEASETEDDPPPPRGPNWRALLPGATASRRSLTNPLLLLAAALLVVGAVLGNWLALGGGWLLAYVSRRLTPAETKWAVLGLPSLAVVGGLVWLWGRQNERWGAPIAEGAMGDAVAGVWPWVVRGAALSSAAFLAWRSQRHR
ncbi:hypothetical protein [Streptomyces sp. BPTC-684]|uniref:hypothetical protein n=1 Tax=Streptomyces sp. BPTC-684 TaxID=3043734 RepID=UPI0024B14C1A|nr:hypothetical protein [Streptomyces sp. BPTC-684]WHM38116.1 hypothetical protein QIY60_15135 [Streptomyces sp. BPTC-684]